MMDSDESLDTSIDGISHSMGVLKCLLKSRVGAVAKAALPNPPKLPTVIAAAPDVYM
jgi:hypothetical protein